MTSTSCFPRSYRLASNILVGTLCAMLVLAGGCKDGGLSLATVEGTVAYQEKPLTHGTVTLLPDSGSATHIGVGSIQANGTFRIETTNRDGAVPGVYAVVVQCRREPTPEESRNLVITESLIPEQYGRGNTTPLRFEVNAGKNQMPLVLE